MLDKAKIVPNANSIHSLRLIVSGGAPLTPDVYEGLAAVLGVPVLEHYGASEAAQICANLPPPGPSKPGTCGIPTEGTLKIVGEDGHQLAPNERGEILVGGPNVISGYLEAPELNRNAFINGWFRTGDIGSLDTDGFLTLHGREKEIINRGGEKISPLEIDQAILRHPEVAEAAAFAIPHPRLGEDVAAAVVLKEGARVSPMDLREFLASQLALFKVPRRIVLVDHLPKGVTGKILRRRLVEHFK
jgi:acyl-CoA synthetase (AMP-forming)/AMP-acid ligase II